MRLLLFSDVHIDRAYPWAPPDLARQRRQEARNGLVQVISEARQRKVDAVLCINLIHIAPWEACLGLLYGCEQLLPPGGPLVLYGPFMRGGVHTAASNAAFDASLRQQDPRWGVRDLDDVVREAALRGFHLAEVVAMPASNLTLVLRYAS